MKVVCQWLENKWNPGKSVLLPGIMMQRSLGDNQLTVEKV